MPLLGDSYHARNGHLDVDDGQEEAGDRTTSDRPRRSKWSVSRTAAVTQSLFKVDDSSKERTNERMSGVDFQSEDLDFSRPVPTLVSYPLQKNQA